MRLLCHSWSDTVCVLWDTESGLLMSYFYYIIIIFYYNNLRDCLSFKAGMETVKGKKSRVYRESNFDLV
jgi:hypothetical protein